MFLQLEVSFYKLALTACFSVCKSQIMALINAEVSLAPPLSADGSMVGETGGIE